MIELQLIAGLCRYRTSYVISLDRCFHTTTVHYFKYICGGKNSDNLLKERCYNTTTYTFKITNSITNKDHGTFTPVT